MEKEQKVAYEWVLTMSKGEEVILSENQYSVYKELMQADDMRKIFFSEVELNPAFVVTAIKRPAQYIKNKYPCHTCHQGGRNKGNTDWCENCGGSGVDLPKK